MKKTILALASSVAAIASLNAQTPIDPVINSDVTLPANTEWLISGITYVTPGTTLTIEPGVTIYAEGQDTALIVTPGATLNAVGTPFNPIVFTSQEALNRELSHLDVGLWSGVILLGTARINADSSETLVVDETLSTTATNLIEGLDPIGRHGLDVATETTYLTYGGTDDSDSSGTLQFVSIRHTGFSISGRDGDEIQGLSIGGVGSGTVLENIEIFGSNDDGIEIFGGTVNLRNFVISYATDDSVDLDQGWRGVGQNILVIQASYLNPFTLVEFDGDHGGEWDGADAPEDNFPRTAGIFSNMTFASGIAEGFAEGGNDDVIRIRNAGSYQVWNSAFAVTGEQEWIRLDNNPVNNIVQDAFGATTAFVGNIYFDGSAAAITADLFDLDDFTDPNSVVAAVAGANTVIDHGISVSVAVDGQTDIQYPISGPLYGSAEPLPVAQVPFLNQVDYVGAFPANQNWAAWTFAAEQGYFSKPGWIFTETFGWIYTLSGSLAADQFVFHLERGDYIYLGPDAGEALYVWLP